MAGEAPNAQQIEYWNGEAGERWSALEAELDVQLAAFGERALDEARLAPGARVLDVGCGCGAASLEAARRVAPGGRVLGVDVSGPLLARARVRAARAGAEGLSFLEADAQTHRFAPGGFDAVVSRFGISFFAAPEAAFANLRRALAPGGRLGFVCWQEIARNAVWAAPLAAAAGRPPKPPEPGVPGPFALTDPDRVRRMLVSAGFADVRIEPIEGSMRVGSARTALEAAEVLLEMGPGGAALRRAGAPPALRRRTLEALAEALAPWVGDGGVTVPHAAWLVGARPATPGG